MNIFQNILFNTITDGFKKRVFKFIFKRTFDRFIKEIDLSQIDVQLGSGVVQLENLELKTEGINKFLRDVPFSIAGGYIRKIKVKVPWFNILKESLSIEVNGIELLLDVKETQRTGSVSQTLAESFLGEYLKTDPNVLASSILIGDVSKKDMSEFEDEMISSPMNETPTKSYEGEEYIAKIIEQVVSNIRATVTEATIKIQFESKAFINSSNILLLHFPRLDYSDKTPKSTDDSHWSPSHFKYEFLMKSFVVQLFTEDSKLLSSTFGFDAKNKHLDEGNTILFGDATHNSGILINVYTGDRSTNYQSSIDVKFNIHSIHTCMKPSQLKMLSDMLEALKISMTSQQPVQPVFTKQKQNKIPDLLELKAKQADPHISDIMLSNLGYDDEFKDVEVNDDDDFADARSVESETSPISHMDTFNDVIVDDYKTNANTMDNPLSLKASFQLKSATCTILYEETNLTDMWLEFFGRKDNRDTGPHIPGEHMILTLNDVLLESENNSSRNTLRFHIGGLKITEKFRKTDAPHSNIAKSVLKKSMMNLDYDHFDPMNNKKKAQSPTPELIEENVIYFAPKQEQQKKVNMIERKPSQIFVEFSVLRKDGSVEVKGNFAPMFIKFNAGILARLQLVLNTLNQKTSLIPQAKQLQLADLSKSMEEEILQAIDADTTVVTSTYKFNFDAITLAISFPKITQGVISKIDFQDEILVIHADNLNLSKPLPKRNQAADDVLILCDMKAIAMTLNNAKKGISHSFILIDQPSLNITLRNKEQRMTDQSIAYESALTRDLSSDDEEEEKQTPKQESKSDEMFAESLDAEVDNQKQIASAALAVVINTNKMSVNLNKAQFDLIQKLINDLSVGVTTAMSPTPISSQILNSQATANQPSYALPVSSDDDLTNETPDFAFKLAVNDIVVTLNDLISPNATPFASKHTYQVHLKDFMTLVSTYQSIAPVTKIQVQAEDINIAELFSNPTKKQPILRGFKKLVKEFRNNKSAFMSSISLKQMPIFSKIIVAMQLNGLYLNYHQELPDDLWVMCLLGFISTTDQADAQSVTSVHIVMHDCVVDYSPLNIQSRLLACLNRTKFTTQIVTVAKETTFDVSLEGASVHLHDKYKLDIIEYLDAHPNEASEFGFINDLKNLEFVQVASLNSLTISVKMHAEPTPENPAMCIDISNGTILIDSCSDSFNTLQNILSYFGNQKDIEEKVAKVTKWKMENAASKPVASVPPMNAIVEQQSKSIDNNTATPAKKKLSILLSSMNENFFDQDMDAVMTKSTTTSTPPVTPPKQEKKINILSHIIEDHFPLSTSADAAMKRELPKDYPVSEFEVVVHDKVEIVITLYGGYDWGEQSSNQNKSSNLLLKKTILRSNRDVTRMIEVRVTDIFVQFNLFKVTDRIAMRTRFSIKDFEVIDKVKKSTRNKIATYMKNPDKPRELRSRMIDLLLESVRTSLTSDNQEFKLKLSVLPIRVNIHEEALVFLLEFFGLPNPFKKNETEIPLPPTPPPNNTTTTEPSAPNEEVKFQSIEISPIVIKIDYEPAKLDISELRKGNLAALINVAQIKGLVVSLSPVNLAQISGSDALVQQITQIYLNDVMGTQLFRFLLGLMPVRVVYNVGSGVYDLIAIPIDEYNRDGSLLRGFRRGVASCVSGIAQGTVGMTAIAANTATNVLKGITNVFGDDQEAQKPSTPAMPAGAMEGVHHAYATVSDGFSNARLAIVALPRTYQTKGVGSVLKAVPQVILSPIIGTTEALGKLLSGVQQSLSKEDKTEYSDVYKQ